MMPISAAVVVGASVTSSVEAAAGGGGAAFADGSEDASDSAVAFDPDAENATSVSGDLDGVEG